MTKHISTNLSASAPAGTADANLADDYLRWIQEAVLADLNGFPGNILTYGTSTAADSHTFTGTPAMDGYYTGMILVLNKAGGSTNATTTPSVNIDALGAKTIKRADGNAVAAGDLVVGLNLMIYDGTDFLLLASYAVSFTTDKLLINKTAVFDDEGAASHSSVTLTIDWATGNKQEETLTTTDITTVTFTNPPPGPCNLILRLTQDSVTPVTCTGWPASVYWVGGTEPVLTNTVDAIDIISFYFDGTNYYGAILLDFS